MMKLNMSPRVQLSRTKIRKRPISKGRMKIPSRAYATSTAKYVAEFCRLNHLINCHIQE